MFKGSFRAEQAKLNVMKSALTVGTGTVLGAVVGYRNAKGVAPDKVLPSVGPVPVDLLIGGVGKVVALSRVAGKYSEYISSAADGALTFFGITAGQSLGKKIAEKSTSAKGRPAKYNDEYRKLMDAARNIRPEAKEIPSAPVEIKFAPAA